MDIMQQSLNHFIDHTLLKPEATLEEIEKLCSEAVLFQFASVCIQPTWAIEAYNFLKETNVKVCSVVGFPLGANTTECKAFEAQELVKSGVHEIDMVINIGALKSKDYKKVLHDIKAVVLAAKPALVKVIIETCLLTDEEKKEACLIAVEAGALFVKTSTGFSKSGATIHDVSLMREIVGPDIGVKASGGIRDLLSMLAMIKAGATRIGTSSGVAIMQSSLSDKETKTRETNNY